MTTAGTATTTTGAGHAGSAAVTARSSGRTTVLASTATWGACVTTTASARSIYVGPTAIPAACCWQRLRSSAGALAAARSTASARAFGGATIVAIAAGNRPGWPALTRFGLASRTTVTRLVFATFGLGLTGSCAIIAITTLAAFRRGLAGAIPIAVVTLAAFGLRLPGSIAIAGFRLTARLARPDGWITTLCRGRVALLSGPATLLAAARVGARIGSPRRVGKLIRAPDVVGTLTRLRCGQRRTVSADRGLVHLGATRPVTIVDPMDDDLPVRG